MVMLLCIELEMSSEGCLSSSLQCTCTLFRELHNKEDESYPGDVLAYVAAPREGPF